MISMRVATEDDVLEAVGNAIPIFQNGHDHSKGMLGCVHKGMAIALEDENKNLCGVMGIQLIWGGVASIGAVLTPQFTAQPKAALQISLQAIARAEEFFKLHRIEMYVQTDYKTGHRWAKALGFQAEGVLRHFGPDGKDHTVYGRVKWTR